MPNKRYQKGIIPLAILGVGFLVLSLAGVSAVVSNPDASFAINSWAKGKTKSARDIGNPRARKAAMAAEKANSDQVKWMSDNCKGGCTADQLKGDTAGFYKSDVSGTYYPVAASEGGPSVGYLSEAVSPKEPEGGAEPEKPAESGAQEAVEVPAPVAPAVPATTQKSTGITTGGLTSQLDSKSTVQNTQPSQLTNNTSTFNQNPELQQASQQVESVPVPNEIPKDILEIKDPVARGNALQSWSNAQRRELINDVIVTTSITYEDIPQTSGRVKANEVTITRNRATGAIVDSSTKTYNVIETAEKKPGAFESKSTYTETSSKIDMGGGRQVDTISEYEEGGKLLDTDQKIYLIKKDGTKARDYLGEIVANVALELTPPAKNQSTANAPALKTGEHKVGDTWVEKDVTGVYRKYEMVAGGGIKMDTAFKPKVDTVVGRENTTTIVRDPTTGEILTSSSEPNKVPLYKQIGKFLSGINQNVPEQPNPGDVWLEKNPSGYGYVRKTQQADGGIKTEVFANTSVQPAEGPLNDTLVVTDPNSGEVVGYIEDAKKAAELKKINEQNAPDPVVVKEYPPNSTIVETNNRIFGGRVDKIIKTNKEGQVIDQFYAYYTDMKDETSRFEQGVSDIINWIYNATLPR